MLNTQTFTHHMKAMNSFYKTAPSHSYALPVDLMSPHSNTTLRSNDLLRAYVAVSQPAPSLAPVLSSIEIALSQAFNQQQSDANKTVQLLNAGSDMAAVISGLKSQKASAKVAINQVIDDGYKQLMDFGIKYPQTQSEVLKLASNLGSFIASLLNSMGKYFDQLGQEIIKWSQTVIVESAWGSITSWFNNAAHSIVKFFKDVGAAIESAFETLESAAKAAWNDAKELIKKAIEAGEKAILEPIAKAVLDGLPIADLRQAWSVVSSNNGEHIAQIRSDVMNKKTTVASRASMKAIAAQMAPHLNNVNTQSSPGLQAAAQELQPYSVDLKSYLSFGIEFQATASAGLGIEGAIGMLSGIPNVADVAGYGAVGGSLGVEVGAEADVALVLKMMAPKDTGGVYVGVIASLEAEVGGTAQVQFTFPGFELSGVSIGLGAGVEAGIAIDGGYTWIF